MITMRDGEVVEEIMSYNEFVKTVEEGKSFQSPSASCL